MTTISKLFGRTALDILKVSALVLVSSSISMKLREKTQCATEGIVQTVRFTKNKLKSDDI